MNKSHFKGAVQWELSHWAK